MMQKQDSSFFISNKVRGIFMMLMHVLALSVLYNVQKVVSAQLPPLQIAFLYKFMVLLLVIPWCLVGGVRKNLKTDKIGIHLARGALSIMGSICFLYGLKHINTTDAAALTFLENVIVVIIGVLYFKEEMNYSRVALIFFGAVGALLIIRPGIIEFNRHYIFIFMALAFWAFNNMSIKVLGKTERSRAQLFYVMLFSCLISFPISFYQWEPVSLVQLKYIFIMAVLYLIHLITIFKAFKFADFSVVMPFDYTRLIFTGLISYALLGETPDIFKIMGYCFIMIGGLILLEYEARTHRRKKRKRALAEGGM